MHGGKWPPNNESAMIAYFHGRTGIPYQKRISDSKSHLTMTAVLYLWSKNKQLLTSIYLYLRADSF